MLRYVILISLFAACGESTHDSGVELVGECDPPDAGVDVPVVAFELYATDCLRSTTPQLYVVESTADWEDVFECDQPIPRQLDFTTQRAALVHVACTPIDFHFASETSGNVVIGVLTRTSGACLQNVVVVPLPRSTKPVRLARCEESCESCPPVP